MFVPPVSPAFRVPKTLPAKRQGSPSAQTDAQTPSLAAGRDSAASARTATAPAKGEEGATFALESDEHGWSAWDSVAGRPRSTWFWQPAAIDYPQDMKAVCATTRPQLQGSLSLPQLPCRGTRTVEVNYRARWDSPNEPYAFTKPNATYAPEQREHLSALLRTCGPTLEQLDLSGCPVREFYRMPGPTRTTFQPDMEPGEPAPSARNFDWDGERPYVLDRTRLFEDFSALRGLRQLNVGGSRSAPYTLLQLLRALPKDSLRLDVLDLSDSPSVGVRYLPENLTVRTVVAERLYSIGHADEFNLDVEDLAARALPRGLQVVRTTGGDTLLDSSLLRNFVYACQQRHVVVELV